MIEQTEKTDKAIKKFVKLRIYLSLLFPFERIRKNLGSLRKYRKTISIATGAQISDMISPLLQDGSKIKMVRTIGEGEGILWDRRHLLKSDFVELRQ